MKKISVEFRVKNYAWLARHLETTLEEEERMVEHYAKDPKQIDNKKRHEEEALNIKKTLSDLYGLEG